MTTGKLSRYPAVYSRILLAIPADGRPLEIVLKDEVDAKRERLSFYNFLKFVRRSQKECAHLHAENRANRVRISLQGRVLVFTLINPATSTLEQAFQSAVGAEVATSPVTVPLAPDASDSVADDLIFPDLDEAPNPLDILSQFNKEQKS